jgi:HAD superfamily hydrolase (TIGR01490 family)
VDQLGDLVWALAEQVQGARDNAEHPNQAEAQEQECIGGEATARCRLFLFLSHGAELSQDLEPGYWSAVPQTIAFFDLDLTLLEVNSARLWVRRELRLGHISKWSALKGACWLGVYELGFARLDTAMRTAARTIAGQEECEIQQRTVDFWREELSHRIRPGGLQAIRAHQAAGEAAILLTSSSDYLGQLAVDALGMDGLLCNRFVVEQGRFTGELVDPICYSEGKRIHAEQAAEERGVSLEQCAFYTDSMSDSPVLEAVGRPFVVAPDPRLRREAQLQSWSALDWDASELDSGEEA